MGKQGETDRVHERCGKPWSEHRLVTVEEWLEVPVCDDEGVPGDQEPEAPPG